MQGVRTFTAALFLAAPVFVAAAVVECTPASAAPCTSTPRGAAGVFTGAVEGHAITVDGSKCVNGSAAPSGAHHKEPAVEVVYLPACEGNVPGSVVSKDGSCAQALAMCSSTVVADDVMFWRFERVVGPPVGPWVRVGGGCLRPSQVPGGVVPGLSLAQFRRLPLPAGVVHVQPGSLRTLVNVPTNVFVSVGPVELTTRLVGQPVRVRAWPVGFGWVFGDGGVLDTTDPGGAYPAMTTTHVYRRAGVVGVGLVTRYRGEYSVAGGPWLPVEGEAEVASAPVRVTVVATRNELVSGPLPATP